MMSYDTLALGDFQATEATFRGAREDEQWFEQRPRRSFRLRRILRDEYPAPATHVMCTRLEPGVLIRNSFRSEDDPPNTDLQGECLWQMWGNDPLSPKYGAMVADIKRREG